MTLKGLLFLFGQSLVTFLVMLLIGVGVFHVRPWVIVGLWFGLGGVLWSVSELWLWRVRRSRRPAAKARS